MFWRGDPSYLFVIRNEEVPIRCRRQAIRLAIPFCSNRDLFVRFGSNLEDPAKGYVDDVQIPLVIGYRALEEDVLEASSETAAPFRFLSNASLVVWNFYIELGLYRWWWSVEIHCESVGVKRSSVVVCSQIAQMPDRIRIRCGITESVNAATS
jgi:hypothetical protein